MAIVTARQPNQVAHFRREHFRFIESSLLWEGSVQRQRVCNAFHLSANHVTKVLREYDEAHPGSLVYDQRRQSYVPGRRFKPRYASPNPAEYLALQLVYAESGSSVILPLLGGGVGLPVEAVPTPPLGIDESVLRHVLHAIGEGKGLDVLYHSTRASSPGRRKLWPHALVYTGVRWHVRAYDAERKEFRNFALQRIEEPKPFVKAAPAAPEEDIDWVQRSTLKVVPNPKLNQHQQRLVAREFGMTQTPDGPVWTVELRHCLIGYFAARYGLDRERATPAQQRIVLESQASLQQWFMPAGET